MKKFLRSLKLWRYLTYWIYIFLSIAVPLIIITEKYELFYKASNLKLTGCGIIVAIVVIFFIRKEIVKAVNEMEKGILRAVLQGIIGIIPLAILNVLLIFAETQMVAFKFIVIWSTVSNVLACVPEAIHQHLCFKIKQADIRNAVKGA